MQDLIEEEIQCPYCGEFISILIDPTVPGQRYIEDCQICCRPIVISYQIDEDGGLEVLVHREDE